MAYLVDLQVLLLMEQTVPERDSALDVHPREMTADVLSAALVVDWMIWSRRNRL